MSPEDITTLQRAAQWLYPIDHSLSMRLTAIAQRAAAKRIQAIPAGWIPAPLEPTDEMVAAAVAGSDAQEPAALKALRDRFREEYLRAVAAAAAPT